MKNIQQIIETEKPLDDLVSFQSSFCISRLDEIAPYMNRKVASSDIDQLRSLVHQWVGFAQPYGFNHLAVIGAKLRESLIENDFKLAQDLIVELNDYLSLKKQYIKA